MLNYKKKNRVQKECVRKHKIIASLFIILATCLVIAGVGFLWYTGNYYHATKEAETALSQYDEGKVIKEKDVIIFEPENYNTGFIFYPGGKVEFTAYAPLLKALAEKDILCILVKMPFNLAVFDIEAASKYLDRYQDLKTWYIGGHSLGGAMAAKCLSENKEKFQGLILLAAYSTSDISNTNTKVLSIYGSQDKVLDRKKQIKYANYLPDSTEVVDVEGGCHSYFGYYGKQKGDGDPFITREEQIAETVSLISNFVKQPQ